MIQFKEKRYSVSGAIRKFEDVCLFNTFYIRKGKKSDQRYSVKYERSEDKTKKLPPKLVEDETVESCLKSRQQQNFSNH